MGVSKANTVSHLDGCDLRTDCLDNANALVAENHIGLQVMLIGSTETRMGSLDEKLIMLKGGSTSAGEDLALRRATESVRPKK